jgi:glycosyltransferase involved in cell wall biosynthesis
MSTPPRISVCLLSYNHGAILGETLETVLSQSFSDFELIISDDHSRDDSWAVIESFARRDARVRPVRPPQNLGMARNANFAVAQARTDYVALLHHDDLCRADLLARWYELVAEHPRVGFVTNAFAVGGPQRIDYHPFDRVTNGREALERILLPRWGCPVRGTAMIRRSAWERAGGMRPQFGMLADVDLWMRLARDWDVGYVREPLLTVRAERPEDYPADYVHWTWDRQRLLYEIHGVNREEYFGRHSLRGRYESVRFRTRVSVDELKWLSIGLARRNEYMLSTSPRADNPYELPPIRWLRTLLTLPFRNRRA